MSIIGIGVDIVEIERFNAAMQRQGQRLLDRLFHPSERSFCAPQKHPARCFAARFAVKEAVAKALGTGIGAQLGWLDIEIHRKPTGEPHVTLSGTGAGTARKLGIAQVLVSLSHSEHYAVANAVAVGPGGISEKS